MAAPAGVDTVRPADLLLIARHLAAGVAGKSKGRPRETELRRAVSATYYALIHTLARCGADLLVGKTKPNCSQPAWQQTYRALEHGNCRKQRARNSKMFLFPPAIQDFAAVLVRMQEFGHLADYDPLASFSRSTVLQGIEET